MNAKRMAALVLAMVMLLECVPVSFAEEMGTALAQPKRAEYETIVTQHGPTLKDQTLDGDLILTGMNRLYLDGAIAFTGGGRLVVHSGEHRISRDAVIKGDIVIEGDARLEIDGIVEGEILLDQKTQGNDIWCEVEIGEHAVVRAIRSEGFSGRVTIRGSVSRIEVQGEYGGRDSEPEHTGEFQVVENAYVGTAVIRGDYAASLQARDNALISSLTIDGWGWSGIFGAHVQRFMVSGGTYISVEEGAEIDYLEMNGLATQMGTLDSHIGEAHIEGVGPNNEVYHGGLWLSKGSSLDTAYVGKDGRLVVNNVDFEECDALTGTPYEQIDWRPLYKESVVDTVYLTSNAELQNKGYIKKLYSKGKTSVLHMGKVGYGYVENSDDYHFLLEDPNRPDGTYHDGITGLINSNVYADSMGDYMVFKNSNVMFGTGIVLGTVQMDSCHVNLEEFNRIDTLIINRPTNADVNYPQEFESYFVNEGRINNLLLCYAGNWYCHDTPMSMTVDKAAVYGMASKIIYDIGKLYVPSGHKTAESALHNGEARIEEGVRPTQEMLDTQLAQMESDPQSMEGVELITVPEPGEAYYVGEVIPASVKKADSQIIRGGTTKDKAETLKLRSNSIRKREARDWWYQIEVEPLQTLNLAFDAGEGMGALTIMGPNDDAYTLVSAGEPASTDILCRDGGTYYLRLTGAENDYKVVIKATDPIRVDWDVSMQHAAQKGNGEKTTLDLTALDITVENKTRGTQPEFIVTQDAIVMTNDQADPGDTLVLTVKDPEDAFIPASVEVRLSKGKAAKKTTVYEYGSYRATCTDFTDVTMHLYDGNGHYIRTLDEHRGVFTAQQLLPGAYQVVMIRGDVGRWRFAKLSDYEDFGLEEGRDYRLDAFALKEGFTDSYPSATVPKEPVLDSPYAIESESRYHAARSACLVGGSVLMRVDYALENEEAVREAYVDVQLGEGMSVQPEYVTLDGEAVPAQLEGGVLRVPVTGHSEGQIAFYAFGGEVSELLSMARLTLETGEGTQRAYLGFSNVQMQTLSIGASELSGGTVNLYGYGIPQERVTILHNGAYGVTAQCDGEGRWYAVMDVEATQEYTDHEFAAVLYARTPQELVSPETVTVRVHDSLPELESLTLYYYEHGRLRKLERTAQELYRGKLSYSYEPGTQFNCTVKYANADRLEKLYFVQQYADGREEYLPCTYDAAADAWSFTGKFPHDSMAGTWRFDYQLTPLPEPEPFTQADIDALTALGLPEVSVEVTDLQMNDDGYPVGTVRYTIEGCDPMEFDLDLGVSDEMLDLEYTEEEAAEIMEDEYGNTIYLMKDPDDLESMHFYIIENETGLTYSVHHRLAERALEILLCGVSGQALADDGFFDQAMDQIGTNAAVFGKGILEAIAGLALTAVDVWMYNVQIVRLWNLKNKVIEREAWLADQAAEAKSLERRDCLLRMMELSGSLKGQIQDLANQYGREAAITGIGNIVMDRLGGKFAKAMAGKLVRIKGLRNQFHKLNDLLETAGRTAARARGRLDDLARQFAELTKDSMEKTKAFREGAAQQAELLGKKISEISQKLKLNPEDNYYIANLQEELGKYQNLKKVMDDITNLSADYERCFDRAEDLLEKGIWDGDTFVSDLILTNQCRDLYMNDYTEQLLAAVIELGIEEAEEEAVDPLTYRQLAEQAEELKNMSGDLLDTLTEAAKAQEELNKAEEEISSAEQQKQQVLSEVQALMDEAEQEKKNILQKMTEEAAQEFFDKFIRDYNAVYDKYMTFVDVSGDCPPDPTPPSDTSTTTPPDTTPTPTPDTSTTTPPDNPPTPTPDPNHENPDHTDPGTEIPNNGDEDPSGYVYEGVWSNRIEGVTTTAYTTNERGETVMWDASLHGQQNPLITDSHGYYEWYVPEGMWQVKYEKEGYETSYSEWLPVPPPQTQVHQGIVSYAQPEVQYAMHYGDYVELAFSKPVRTETVSVDTVQIGVPYTAEPQDPERMGEGDVVLASVFRLYPQAALGREITVTVGGGVLSYADVGAADAQLTCTRRSSLKGLEAPGSIELKVGEPGVLLLRAVGQGDYQKYSLTIGGAHGDLLQTAQTAEFDANGQAAVALTPVSACTLTLTIQVPDTDIEAAVKVIVRP